MANFQKKARDTPFIPNHHFLKRSSQQNNNPWTDCPSLRSPINGDAFFFPNLFCFIVTNLIVLSHHVFRLAWSSSAYFFFNGGYIWWAGIKSHILHVFPLSPLTTYFPLSVDYFPGASLRCFRYQVKNHRWRCRIISFDLLFPWLPSLSIQATLSCFFSFSAETRQGSIGEERRRSLPCLLPCILGRRNWGWSARWLKKEKGGGFEGRKVVFFMCFMESTWLLLLSLLPYSHFLF